MSITPNAPLIHITVDQSVFTNPVMASVEGILKDFQGPYPKVVDAKFTVAGLAKVQRERQKRPAIKS